MGIVRRGAPDKRVHYGEILRIGDRVTLFVSLRDDVRVADPVGGKACERANRGVVEATVGGIGRGGIGLGEAADVRGNDELGIVVACVLEVVERGGRWSLLRLRQS